jgi:4-amino-4-deoxy-L-arabinose transferase-like glycosyltransferase
MDNLSVPSESCEPGTNGRPVRNTEKWFLGVLILASLMVRLIQITQPFVDAWSWKQLTNAMVSRNFFLHGYHFFYPQVDWAGPYPGYIGTEFPLVPFTASLFYPLFGIHEWIGRSVSVLFFIMAVPAFYLLIRRISSIRAASFATMAYCMSPLAFMASRSFQSDIASLSFAVIAIYFFTEWLDRPSSIRLFILASAATALAILTKLPQLVTGVPLLYLAWDKYRAGLWRNRQLWLFALLALAPPLLWELHAYHVSATQYPYHFAGQGGVRIMGASFYWQLIKETVTESLTPVLAAGFVGGLFLWPRSQYGKVFHAWFVGFILFVIFAAWENRHPWVQLPAVPIAAGFFGLILDRVACRVAGKRHATLAVGAVCVSLFVVLAVLLYGCLRRDYRPWQLPAYRTAAEMRRILRPNDLIMVPDEGDPLIIYYSGHKGWHFMEEFGWHPGTSAEAIGELERLRAQGGRYFVVSYYQLWWFDYYKDFRTYLDTRYHRVAESPEYVVYDLFGTAGTRDR